MGRAFCHGASPIRADRWGMPGPRELSFTAVPEAVSSRGHVPASVCLSTSCLSCPALQQLSHPSPPATGSANPKPHPGRCWSSLGSSDPIPCSRTALPSPEQHRWVSPAASVSPHLRRDASSKLPPSLAALPSIPPPLFSLASPYVLPSLSPVPLECCHERKW